MDRLMPAAATYLARIIRVRQAAGTLPLVGYADGLGGVIPDLDANGPNGAASGGDDGIDGDLVLRIDFGASTLPCQAGAEFVAGGLYSDQATKRPIYGVGAFCTTQQRGFYHDLETVMHQLIHVLAMFPELYGNFPGYARPYDDVVLTTDAGGEARDWIHTPQVAATVQSHFACPALPGAAMEDSSPARLAHLEERNFMGELMTAGAIPVDAPSGQRPLLTDVTLSILQDSNWYDVKYGSASFNSFGYRAGCEFAVGTPDEAAEAPAAQVYQCTASQRGSMQCMHDHSAVSLCSNSPLWENLFLVPYEPRLGDVAVDCHNNGTASGQRCIATSGSQERRCAAMSCSPDGAVLVDGVPCGPGDRCPDEELMCGDPGLLTCVDTLNDCSGHGDCLNGHCFCHIGWGGDDCSVPICSGQCEDGTPCPASGFCGVPECGEWSEGSDSRGVPCNADAYTMPPALNTSAAAPANGTAAPAPAAPLGDWFSDPAAPAPAARGGPDVGVAISGEPPSSIGVPLAPGTPVIGTPTEEAGAPALDSDTFPGAAERSGPRLVPYMLATIGATAAVLLR